MATPTQPRRATPIQGSWEDIFNRAQQASSALNDEAIPLYRRIIDGLGRIPLETRLAGNRRLQNMLMASGFGLQGLLNIRDRYDESLETLNQLLPLADTTERDEVESQIIDVMQLAGQVDDAAARLRASAEDETAEMGDWGLLFSVLMRHDRFDEAQTALAALEQHLVQKHANAPQDDRAVDQDRAYLAGLRAIYALETGSVEDGLRFSEQALLGDAYSRNPQVFYLRLIKLGRYADAMRMIAQDQDNPIRAGFWRGLALQKAGKFDDARAQWRRVTQMDRNEQNLPSVVEYILSHYYLGDAEGEALGMILEALRKGRNISSILLFLAGVGWAVRGNFETARHDLQLAVTQHKATGDGMKLPADAWTMSADLFDDAGRAQLAEFFEGAELPAIVEVSTDTAMGSEAVSEEQATADADIEPDAA